MTPPGLASWLQSLPPILHMIKPNPMPSCSKAPRGLSVLLRVNGIFTVIAISLGPSLRQWSDHYAIRAGRNLPDKEFRYLRTVIVTAAVYWGFSSKLAPLPLTFQHWAGVSPYTSTYVLAQTCVFDKQLPDLFRCGLHCWRQSISRSYARCFAEFLSEGSPNHLRLLASTTWVGLRYGRQYLLTYRFSSPCLHLNLVLRQFYSTTLVVLNRYSHRICSSLCPASCREQY